MFRNTNTDWIFFNAGKTFFFHKAAEFTKS